MKIDFFSFLHICILNDKILMSAVISKYNTQELSLLSIAHVKWCLPIMRKSSKYMITVVSKVCDALRK